MAQISCQQLRGRQAVYDCVSSRYRQVALRDEACAVGHALTSGCRRAQFRYYDATSLQTDDI